MKVFLKCKAPLFVDDEQDNVREVHVHVELILNNIVTEFNVAQVKIYVV